MIKTDKKSPDVSPNRDILFTMSSQSAENKETLGTNAGGYKKRIIK